MNPITEFRDVQQFREALDDQAAMMVEVEVRRCIGINKSTSYPGNPPEVLRNSIFMCAEVKPIAIGESDKHGGALLVSDLEIRSDIELRGTNQKNFEYGDMINPETVADIIVINAPYQGEWYVVGIPEPGTLNQGQEQLFWNVNIRRMRTGAIGK